MKLSHIHSSLMAVAAATAFGFSSASVAQEGPVYNFVVPISGLTSAPEGPTVSEKNEAWKAYADATGNPYPADTDSDGEPNWEEGISPSGTAWTISSGDGLPSVGYPASNAGTEFRPTINDTLSGADLSVFADFNGNLYLFYEQLGFGDSLVGSIDLSGLSGYAGNELYIGRQDFSDISPLSDISVDGLFIQENSNLADISPIGDMSISSSIFIDEDVTLRPGFTPIPSDSYLCLPENSGFFMGNMTQADACAAP